MNGPVGQGPPHRDSGLTPSWYGPAHVVELVGFGLKAVEIGSGLLQAQASDFQLNFCCEHLSEARIGDIELFVFGEKHEFGALSRFQDRSARIEEIGKNAKIKTEKDRWMRFLKDDRSLNLDVLPDWMETSVMRKAVKVMRTITKKEIDFERYLSRVDKRREELTQVASLRMAIEEKDEALWAAEMARIAKERERREKEKERREKEAALKLVDKERVEKQKYRDMLLQAGIDIPDFN